MNEFLQDLITAYGNIPPTYFNQQVIHSLDGQNPTTQDIERVVQAEFYHQWRKIMFDNPTRYNNLILHSEIGKRLANNQGIKQPDLVLHGGQIGENRLTHNKVFVELKMSLFDRDDIIKAFYALQNHGYEFCVCIIHSKTIPQIKEAIEENENLFAGKQLLYSRFYFMNRTRQLVNLRTLIEQ